jgi:hypothetical protein
MITFSRDGQTHFCFAQSSVDGSELYCYDGSQLRQVSNIAGFKNDSKPSSFAVYDDGSGSKSTS